jgi:uracil-DNA glycosylase
MDRTLLLSEIASEVRACTKCGLCESRTQAVPGEGDPFARLMFIGEGPGQQEDQTGRPFVGAAGQLLNRLLVGIGMRREDVFIANVVKCRPPGNRVPEDGEAAACQDWLMSQIALVQPEIIGLLGGTALKWVLSPDLRITKVRGRLYRKDGLLFMPVFHPAYVLRNASDMPKLEQDFRALKELLSRPVREAEITGITGINRRPCIRRPKREIRRFFETAAAFAVYFGLFGSHALPFFLSRNNSRRRF